MADNEDELVDYDEEEVRKTTGPTEEPILVLLYSDPT